MTPDTPKTIVLAVTGASGAIYARQLLLKLLQAGTIVHLVVSKHARTILVRELNTPDLVELPAIAAYHSQLTVHDPDNLGAIIASGSYRTDGMIICPCSINTAAAVAAGRADNLITRAAQVALKEARRLIIAPREMPLSPIDLDNLARLARAGVVVAPACPAFYNGPTSIGDLVDHVVGRLLDLVGIEHDLHTRYTGIEQEPKRHHDRA